MLHGTRKLLGSKTVPYASWKRCRVRTTSVNRRATATPQQNFNFSFARDCLSLTWVRHLLRAAREVGCAPWPRRGRRIDQRFSK
jgi:hypothetical protein